MNMNTCGDSKVMALLLLVAVLMVAAAPATAHTRHHDNGGGTPPSSESLRLEFATVSNGSPPSSAALAQQLFVTVTDPLGRGNVLFSFFNLGPTPSSITGVYFDDGSQPVVRSIDRIFNGLGVRFERGADPFDLPGGSGANPDFHTSRGLSAGTDTPSLRRGVNPGESFALRLRLMNGMQYTDVLDDIRSGDLRVGLYVRGLDGGGVESFVNTASVSPPIPEPSTLAFFAFGALLLGLRWRRSRQSD